MLKTSLIHLLQPLLTTTTYWNCVFYRVLQLVLKPKDRVCKGLLRAIRVINLLLISFTCTSTCMFKHYYLVKHCDGSSTCQVLHKCRPLHAIKSSRSNMAIHNLFFFFLLSKQNFFLYSVFGCSFNKPRISIIHRLRLLWTEQRPAGHTLMAFRPIVLRRCLLNQSGGQADRYCHPKSP